VKLPYREGDWFQVPLRNGGVGVGLVARSGPRGKVLLGYFFGPRREEGPELSQLAGLRPEDAALVARFGDLGLIRGEWPILGRLDSWDRGHWPAPKFARTEEVSGRVWEVEYADDDPNRVVAERPLAEPGGRPRDQLFGAGAVEIALGRRLDQAG
jgi:hypothetical protein